MKINEVALNKKQPIYREVMNNGDLLIIGDKPRIEHKNGLVTGLCLDLRFYYCRSKGFIERKERTDKEVIHLGKKWAETIMKKRQLKV